MSIAIFSLCLRHLFYSIGHSHGQIAFQDNQVCILFHLFFLKVILTFSKDGSTFLLYCSWTDHCQLPPYSRVWNTDVMVPSFQSLGQKGMGVFFLCFSFLEHLPLNSVIITKGSLDHGIPHINVSLTASIQPADLVNELSGQHSSLQIFQLRPDTWDIRNASLTEFLVIPKFQFKGSVYKINCYYILSAVTFGGNLLSKTNN